MAALTEDRDSERAYERDLITRFTTQYERRRHQEIAQARDAVPLDQQPLNVELVEFYARDNARTHHTESYELVHDSPSATPVFRRGLPFYFAVRFTRPFDPAVDNIVLQFNFGPKPVTTKGTRVVLSVTQEANLAEDKRLWDVRVHHQDGTTLTLQVQISTLSPVGVWKCNIISSLIAHPGVINEFKCSEDTYILFNPWCKEDQVYLDKEDLRREYVMNDSGKVWMGSARQPRGRRWVFGQFDDAVLPAVALLLEKSNLPHSERGNPIAVSRAISAVVNCNDEGGLVYGRWVNNYYGGTHPDTWTGSVAILEEFLKTGGRSVRYGQCWVFSACTVTVCRALGLPCRSVTNYVSAHDTNHSLTVDKYFTREGEEMIRGPDGNCRDSCWNYHTWNDVWMSRPDLPPGYGGWQVIDATPQEKSDNLYRCGPASVEAVRRGEVGFLHDTPFVFAEVNADLCHFMEDRNSDWGFSRLYINHYHVGQRIVTKSVDKDDDDGDTDFEDITYLYKDPDGSQAERLAVMNAVRLVPGAQKLYALPPTNAHDVDFDLVEVDSVPLGQPFSVNVHIHNKSEQPRTIMAMLSANSVQYTGATAYRLKRATGEFVVEANQRETLRIQVTPAEYLDKLVDHSLVKIYAIASVKETRQTWSEEDDFPLTKPKLSVQIRGSTQVGQTSQATFSFQNPLNSLLTNCIVSFEGPGLNRPKLMAHRDVKPGELISFTENFRPKRAGEKKLVGAFSSKQLSQVVGSVTINVLP